MTDENAYALLFRPDSFITPRQKRHLFAKKVAVIFQDWSELSVLLAQ